MFEGLTTKCWCRFVGNINGEPVVVDTEETSEKATKIISDTIKSDFARAQKVWLSDLYDSSPPGMWEYQIELPDGKLITIRKGEYSPFVELFIAQLWARIM